MTATLTKVKTRDLNIGDVWRQRVRIVGVDWSSSNWRSQLRSFRGSDEVLATPYIGVVYTDGDTVIDLTLDDSITSTLEPGRAAWALKYEDDAGNGQELFWGELSMKDSVVQ